MLVCFVRQGIEQNERVICFFPRDMQEVIQSTLENRDILPDSQLIFYSNRQVYGNGDFVPQRMLSWLREQTDLALADGFSGLRVAGEFGDIEAVHTNNSELIEYESAVNRLFEEIPCTALCCYNRRQYEPEFLLEALDTHPTAAINGSLYENFYYRPIEKHAAAEFESRIDQLAAHRQNMLMLQKNERTLRSFIQHSPDGIAIVNEKAQIIEWNPGMERITGIAQESAMGRPYGDVMTDLTLEERKTPENARRILGYFQNILDTGQVPDHNLSERAIVRPDGTRATLQISVFPIKTERGFIIGTIVRDVSEAQNIAEALRQSQERFRIAFQTSPDAIAITRLSDGMYVEINEQFTALTGYTRDDLEGRTVFDVQAWANPAIRARMVEALREDGEINNLEAVFRLKSGELRTGLFSAKVIMLNGEPHLLGITHDIEDRIREQKALRESEARYHSLFDNNHAAMLLIEPETGGIVDANSAACRFYNYDRDAIKRMKISDINALSPEAILEEMRRAEDESRSHFEFRHRLAGGEVRDVEVFSGPIQVQGQMLLYSIVHDITARKEAERSLHQRQRELEELSRNLEIMVEERTAALRHLKDRMEAIVNNSPDAILLLDAEGRVETVNRAFREMFGHDFARDPGDLIAPDHLDAFRKALCEALEKKETVRLEITAIRADGSMFDADALLAPILEDHGLMGVVCSIRDITAMKEAERMKDAFVSNVSHELRTPITSIKLYHSLLERNQSKQGIYMEHLKRETSRLANIVEALLLLSRMDQGRIDSQISDVDLNTLAMQFVADRKPIAQQKGLELFINTRSIPPIKGDADLIGQAISILLTNALNYTPEGGTITIRTGTRWSDGGLWAGIAVIDTGYGIAPEDQAHLFERFYRGKAGQESGVSGTGLGLSLAKEITTHHNGKIEVESAPGQGATFSIWLPIPEL